jgi:cell division protein FtsQ
VTPVISAEPETLEVDPRIQARRERVARHDQRRRRRWLLVGLVVITVVTAAWLVTRSALLDVDRVVVTGTARVGADEVREAAGVALGEALLDVDAGAVRQRVRLLPWVADAAVRVRWDGTIEIEVFESEPVAVLDGGARGSFLIDAEGRVLEPVGDGTSGLMVVEGLAPVEPGAHVSDPHRALEVVAALTPGMRTRVGAVVVTDAGNLDLRLRPSGAAWLGRPVELPSKLRALRAALGQVDDRDVAVYDVRVPGQVAVTRSTPPAPGGEAVDEGGADG